MIYLLRHGQTAFNASGRYQGQSDSPLTATGRHQACEVAEMLRPRIEPAATRIFTSPLGRAVETAELIADRLGIAFPVLRDPRLMEVGMGLWDGLSRAEIVAGWPDVRRAHPRGEWVFHGPGGEGHAAVRARLAAALADIARDLAPVRIVVSHAIAGRVLRGIFAGLTLGEAMALEAPQDRAFALTSIGAIERIGPPSA
jgi:broad specificity phosphatase PhoE